MERNHKKIHNFLLILLLGVFFCIGCILIFIGLFGEDNSHKKGETGSQSSINTIEYKGEKYKYNSNLMNILFLGIDNNSEMVNSAFPGDAGQSDCIMILSLNKETRKATIWQIPRDTMTDVDIYDLNGNYYTSTKEQIATQYAYSIGGKSSCWATQKTVSELLYDLPIDGYLALDMGGIATINDAVGGVTITFEEDYTAVDAAFVKGQTLTLKGQQAYDFVHYRDINQSFSNNGRMQRQLQYIPAMIDAIRQKVGEGGNYYEVLYPIAEKYMVTDLTERQLNELAEYELVTSDIKILPGEGKKGEVYEEFYVDEENLQKILIETFYILKN